jgi:hypothetical protein
MRTTVIRIVFAVGVVGLLAAPLVGLFAGCSTDRPDSEFFAPGDVGTLVVDATLIVGQPLPRIQLTRTTTPDQVFNFRESAEAGASVEIVSRSGGTRFQYIMVRPGVYAPLRGIFVNPETTYDLRIVTTDGEVLTATTTTPPRFSIDEWVLLDNSGNTVRRRLRTFVELGDSVYYAPENQLIYTDGLLEGRFERTDVAGYHVGLQSLDLDSDFVFDPAFFDDEDFESLERIISSPPFEAGEGTVRLPWFAIFFQERYKIRVFAVDPNWYDLILTLPEFSGGLGGEAGDDFGRPKFNVNGGIGLFGSGSVDSIGVYILPLP